MKRVYKIKTSSPYVSGIVGHEFRLTLREKLGILFHKVLAVELYSNGKWKDYIEKELEGK